MEGSEASFLMSYNRDYIVSTQSYIKFQLNECVGNKLLYEKTMSNTKQNVGMIVKIEIILVLVAWLAGSYSNKLIGVETLQAVHLIFLMQVFAPRYYPSVSYFKDIHNTLNFYQASLTGQPSTTTLTQLRASFGEGLLDNIALVLALEFTVLVILAVLVVIKITCRK